MLAVREIVPRVGIAEPAADRIEDRVEAGDKHLFWNIGVEQIVDPRQDLAGRGRCLRRGAQHAAGAGHHQGGSHALVRDVADH